MNKLYSLIVVCVAIISLSSGCSSMKSGESTAAETTSEAKPVKEEQPRIVGDIPAGSPFSKIKIGMPMGQVNDLIGPPNDQTGYATGKAFIPFYYGSDRSRVEAYYKGQGRITYAGGSGFGGRSNKVYRIVYDPSENGYNDK